MPKEIELEKTLSLHHKAQKVSTTNFTNFKKALQKHKESIKEEESEEYNKTLLTNFLSSFDYYLNTKDRIDLAIYEEDKPTVIIEAKRQNSTELINHENFNKKSLHQLIFYYLEEKEKHKNYDIKHLIITDTKEFYIFDAIEINNLATNKEVKKLYANFKEEKLFTSKNSEFYNTLSKILKELSLLENLEYSYFNIERYKRRRNLI